MSLRLTESVGPAPFAAATRVGLASVLRKTSRRARLGHPRGSAVDHAFRLGLRDNLSLRWWPQGVTTSADHTASETFAGRQVLVTSSYAKTLRGRNLGSRVTVFALSGSLPTYEHILLVDERGRALRVHAGGIVWHGPYLHVAATSRGLYTFHVDDVVQLESKRSGHRFAWPVRLRYVAQSPDARQRLRYSFLSLDRDGHRLIAGEYGADGSSTRLFALSLDPDTELIAIDRDGLARPEPIDLVGIERMQGAVVVDDGLFVTQSNGALSRGSLWAGQPGALVAHEHVLPAGPEDLTYWPSQRRLWSVTEWPGRRYVYAIDVSRATSSADSR